MRIVAALLLLFHGVAHLVGFRAAFWAPPGLPDRAGLLGGAIGIGHLGSRA
jgi:hypothetical protein